jgi:hypothetical protein
VAGGVGVSEMINSSLLLPVIHYRNEDDNYQSSSYHKNHLLLKSYMSPGSGRILSGCLKSMPQDLVQHRNNLVDRNRGDGDGSSGSGGCSGTNGNGLRVGSGDDGGGTLHRRRDKGDSNSSERLLVAIINPSASSGRLKGRSALPSGPALSTVEYNNELQLQLQIQTQLKPHGQILPSGLQKGDSKSYYQGTSREKNHGSNRNDNDGNDDGNQNDNDGNDNGSDNFDDNGNDKNDNDNDSDDGADDSKYDNDEDDQSYTTHTANWQPPPFPSDLGPAIAVAVAGAPSSSEPNLAPGS